MPLTKSERRRDNKRFNEQVKMAGNALNSGALAILVRVATTPFSSSNLPLVGIAALLYLGAILILALWRAED